METLDIGQLGDLVDFEGVQTDTSDTTVNLVIHPGVLAVIGAVIVGTMNVVGVAGAILEIAIRLGTENLLGLIGDPPARQQIRIEYRNALEFAARGNTVHADFAGMAT